MSARRRAWIAPACLAAAAALGLSACGVGAQSAPHRIDRADVPFGLVERAEAPATPSHAPYSFTIFLVAGDRLQAATRGSQSRPTPRAQLRRLLQGPTPTEADAGLRTLLTPDVAVDDVRVADGIATVALSHASAAQPPGSERALAVAQLVYTATAIPGVDRVRFEVDGEPAEIPRGDGTLTNRPVGRGDYVLAAP
ncbi:MAG TPA: GerMN domain-containing protein [Acidimicrobiia bacterium]|nr:GerMN domain-containing protein [Acidimicrobiia bacterium]